MPRQSENNTRAVERALSILASFTYESQFKGVTELSGEVGLSKSTVHRLLSTLESMGFVEKDLITERYQLGMKLFELGKVVESRMQLRAQATHALESLTAKTGETTLLAMMETGGRTMIYIDQRPSPDPLRYNPVVGAHRLITAGSLGKAILAALPLQEADKLIEEVGLRPYTEKSIVDKELFRADIATVRQRGYAFSDEGFTAGIRGVAAAILEHSGRPIGGIAVVGPSFRMLDDVIPAYGRLVREAADEVSRRLGYIPRGNTASTQAQ